MSFIISEYVEGTNGNQAIELTNVGSSTLDISGYSLAIYSNGSTIPNSSITYTSGSAVGPGQSIVFRSNDPNSQITAGQALNLISHDGNDTYVLRDGSGAAIDIIGQIGSTANFAQDVTLRRKFDIVDGDSNTSDAFDASEWDSFAVDTFDGLGTHSYQTTVIPPSPEGEPSDIEQLMLQYINRARQDPYAEMELLYNTGQSNIDFNVSYWASGDGSDTAGSLATALSQVEGWGDRAPLAWNGNLADSAQTHNELMIQYDVQTHNITIQEHQAPEDEPGLNQRIADGGYNAILTGENAGASVQDPIHGHAGYYIDWGSGINGIQDPPGHRLSMLSEDFEDFGMAYQAVGPTNTIGPFSTTQHFGATAALDPMIIGVVIDDLDNDDFYDIGEGLGGITVTATDGSNSFSTTTWESGGYSLAVAANATYDVTFSGPTFGQSQTFTVTVGFDNVTADAESGSAPSAPTEGADTYVGTIGNENVVMLAGADMASGGGGNDTIDGDSDNDTIDGGDGADLLYGRSGLDSITGGNSDDTIRGGGSNDTLDGESGNDYLVGGGGNDLMNGGVGYDLLIGRAGKDDMNGGLGDDRMKGGRGDDEVHGDEGDDRMWGDIGDDTLNGGDDNDYVVGGDGMDSVDGGAGNDFVEGNDGDDTVNGGSGDDTMRGGEDDDVMNGDAGNDRMSGNDGNDSMDGGANNDSVYGGTGDDTVNGSDGDDYLVGSNGSDEYTGGTGADVFVFDKSLADSGDADVVTDLNFEEGDTLLIRNFGETDVVIDSVEDLYQTLNPDWFATPSGTDTEIAFNIGVDATYTATLIDIGPPLVIVPEEPLG